MASLLGQIPYRRFRHEAEMIPVEPERLSPGVGEFLDGGRAIGPERQVDMKLASAASTILRGPVPGRSVLREAGPNGDGLRPLGGAVNERFGRQRAAVRFVFPMQIDPPRPMRAERQS